MFVVCEGHKLELLLSEFSAALFSRQVNMGAKASTGKGGDLHVSTIFLGETSGKAAGMTETSSGDILVGHGPRILLLDLQLRRASNFAGKSGVGGNTDGHRTDQALFQRVSDMTTIQQTTYIVDCDNCKIRSLDDNVVSTFAGTGNQFVQDGPRKEASFFYPVSIAHLSGTLFVTDIGAASIRIISPDGLVTTLRNQAGDAKYRWKSLLSPSSSKGLSSSSNSLSDPSSQKFQQLKQTEESKDDAIFGEEKDGKLRFGKLRAVCTGRSPHHLYVGDQVKTSGGLLNRVLRFNLDQKEVETLAYSAIDVESIDSLSQSLHGGNSSVFAKNGLLAAGMKAIASGEGEGEEFLLSCDADHHLLWKIGARYGSNNYGGYSVLLGKEGNVHGGSKDGNLKSARVESPSCPIVTSTGDLMWIDHGEKNGSRVRVIKDFGRVVASNTSSAGSKASLLSHSGPSAPNSLASSTSSLASSSSANAVSDSAKTAPIPAYPHSFSSAPSTAAAQQAGSSHAPASPRVPSTSLPPITSPVKSTAAMGGGSLSMSDFVIIPETSATSQSKTSKETPKPQSNSPTLAQQQGISHVPLAQPPTSSSPSNNTTASTPRAWLSSSNVHTPRQQPGSTGNGTTNNTGGQWSPTSSSAGFPPFLLLSSSSSSITASTASLVSSNSIVSGPGSSSTVFSSTGLPPHSDSSFASSAFITPPTSDALSPLAVTHISTSGLTLHRNPSNGDLSAKTASPPLTHSTISPLVSNAQAINSFSAATTHSGGALEGGNTDANSMLLSPSSLVPTSYGQHVSVSIPTTTFSLDKSTLMTDWQLVDPNRANVLSVPLSSSPSAASSMPIHPAKTSTSVIQSPTYM